MKTKLSSLLLAVLCLSCWTACTDDDISGGEPTPQKTAKLEVTVEEQTDTGIVLVQGAHIYLFEFKEYRDDFSKIAYELSTDGSGKYTFHGLQKDEYWITVTLPQPDGRSKNFFDSVPFPTPTSTNVSLNRLLAIFK